MKLFTSILFPALIILTSCSNNKTVREPISKVELEALSDTELEQVIDPNEIPEDVFTLTYSWAGIGSNMGTLAPVFAVKGTHYEYTMQQNSYARKQTKATEKVCEGEISETTKNEIIELVKNIKDSLVYGTNAEVMSGGIYSIAIQYRDIDVEFKLHNASDPIATKIVDLLNSHIPKEYRRLSIWTD